MAVTVYPAGPTSGLYDELVKLIADGVVTEFAWDDGFLVLTSAKLTLLGRFQLFADEGALIFGVLAPAGVPMGKRVFARFHAKVVEMVLGFLVDLSSGISVSAGPLEGIDEVESSGS